MFKRTTLNLAAFIIIIGCANGLLRAQVSSMNDSVHRINEVVIIARPFQEIIPSQHMSRTQLERLSSHNVADAMRYFAGVQLKDYGGMGGLKTINVRNMGSQHVGVFYDGIQLGNATNGTIDLGKYSLDDMEEISLYNGQKSEIFQAAKDYSSASSVYMRTKRPRFGDEKKTNILVRYKAGSIHLINPSVRLEQKLSNSFSMSVSSEYVKSGGEYKFRYKKKNIDGSVAYDTTALRKNSDIEAHRIEGALFGAVGDGYLETKLYYYTSERGLPGPILNNVFEHGDRMKDKNFFVQSSYTKDFSRRYKLKGQAKFAFDYTGYTPLSDSDGHHYYQQEIYASLINMYTLASWWNVALSADYQWNKLNANASRNIDFAYPTRTSTYLSLSNALDFGQLKMQASILTTLVEDDTKTGQQLSDKSELTPSIFLGYQPFAEYEFNLRAFYKRIFRMPTFNELYYGNDWEVDLRPEYTNQYNIGFSYKKTLHSSYIRSLGLQVDAYFLDITDKITATPTNAIRWTVANTGKVTSKGIDVAANAESGVGYVNINTSLTYSYSQSKQMTKQVPPLSSYGHQIPYTPWHSGSAIIHASYSSWNVNYSYSYVGKRYSSSNNTKRYEMQAWYSHDMSVQKNIKYKKHKICISAEINNALNKYYDVVINYPMPGRTFKFIINMEL